MPRRSRRIARLAILVSSCCAHRIALMPSLMDSSNPSDWSGALSSYGEALDMLAAGKKDPSKLKSLDAWYMDSKQAAKTKGDLDTSTLSKIVEWKLSRGTFRPGLLQKAQSNDEKTVRHAYSLALAELMPVEQSDGKRAIGEDAASADALAAATRAVKAMDKNLFGVGPATATAVLARVFPGSVAFMSDDTMLGCGLFSRSAEIKYDMKTFSRFNEIVQSRARLLNSRLGRREWTGDAVGRALWARQVLARLGGAGGPPKAPAAAAASAKRPAATAGGALGVRKTIGKP